MSHDAINSWIKQAKTGAVPAPVSGGVQVIRRVETRGSIIMEMAESLFPYLMEVCRGVRGADGMLMQPAHVRGIALNAAEDLMKHKESQATH